MVCQFIQKKQEEKKIKEEQAADARYWKILACCDDDDDYNFAITPNEPVDSLSMGDEHLNSVSGTELDEFIKSSVENLVPYPSESKGENGCDVPACFTTFSNVLFDVEYEFQSSDNPSCSDEDVPEKIFSNPLFDEEIISMKIDPHHFNAESDLIESMLNHDSLIISSSNIDSLLDEFIEFVSKNSNADTESFSPSPIPVEDSDSFMEEIDLSFTPDDLMPPGIEENDDDSKRDILILEELFDNYFLSLPENESFHFDIPLFSRPPVKAPDGLLQVEGRLVEFKNQEVKYCEKIKVLEFKVKSRANCIESLTNELELLKKEKEGLESKLTGFQSASKGLDSLLESQRLDKNKEGLGYSDVPPPSCSSLLSSQEGYVLEGLPEFADDTITDYSRPSPTIESKSHDLQNRNFSVTETGKTSSSILSKPTVKFVKVADCTKVKTKKVEAARKSSVRYEELYRKTPKGFNVIGNQRNWNNLKSQQLDPIQRNINISEQKVPIPGLMITRVSNQEKSPDLLSHQGPEIFQPSAKCPMMIHGKNIPILDVPLFHFYPPLSAQIWGVLGQAQRPKTSASSK
nr:hypothetical protein [Tanacetum cinerariifolium]